MYMCCMHVYMSTTCMCMYGNLRDQKRSAESLELELRMVVNHSVSAEN